MLKAKDIMTPSPISIGPDCPIAEALSILLEHRFNGLPVTDGQGHLLGLLCQSDLLAQQQELKLPSVFSLLGGYIEFGTREAEKSLKKMTALTAKDAMSQKVTTVTLETSLEDIANVMLKTKYYTLPVLHEGQLVGIIGKEDLLKTMQNSSRNRHE